MFFEPVAENRVREPEDVVNTFFQLERVFHPNKPWDRWWASDTTPVRRDWPVVVDDWAVQNACNLLGLIHKPRIYQDLNELGATHRPMGLPAFITLDHCMTPQAVSTALWHELVHCLQHERNGFIQDGVSSLDLLRQSIDSYWDDPHEIEARRWEVRGSDFPLVTEYDGRTLPEIFNPWGSLVYLDIRLR